MGRAAVYAVVAMSMACGDPSASPSSPDAASSGSDGGSETTDAAGSDAGGMCELAPYEPQPLQCKQTAAWFGYWRDVVNNSGGEQVAVVEIGDTPGDILVASGDKRPTPDNWSFSPDGGAVTFIERYSGFPWNLYVTMLTSDGPGEPRTVSGPFKVNGLVRWYAWSPDGRKIAYTADQEHDAAELWVLDLESDGYAQRVNPPLEYLGWVDNGSQPPFVWSPDSRRLLYRASHDEPEQFDLYVVDVSGVAPAPPIRLTQDLDGTPRWFAWTPDGTAVAFTIGSVDSGLYLARVGCDDVDGPHRFADWAITARFSPSGDELYFLGESADGNALYRADLTETPPVAEVISEGAQSPVAGEPAWSSTGIRVAFLTNSGRLELLDGVSGEREIVNGPLVNNGGVYSFAWSPDGNSIAYAANQLDYTKIELFHVDLSGDAPARRRRVSPSVGHSFHVDNILWSPDSSHVAYRANQDDALRIELYAAERQGGFVGAPSKLNEDLTRDNASTGEARWSPDGTRVLYIADDRGAFLIDLFVVELESPGQPTLIDGPDLGAAQWAPCPIP